jgi:hypothetical protein
MVFCPGLAGLACGLQLAKSNVSFRILEASDGVGGRVRTDNVEGFLLDRGFQIFLTSYPEAQAVLDYEALDLRPFYAGRAVLQLDLWCYCCFYDAEGFSFFALDHEALDLKAFYAGRTFCRHVDYGNVAFRIQDEKASSESTQDRGFWVLSDAVCGSPGHSGICRRSFGGDPSMQADCFFLFARRLWWF